MVRATISRFIDSAKMFSGFLIAGPTMQKTVSSQASIETGKSRWTSLTLPMRLEKGARYAALLRLSGFEKLVASESQVASRIEDAGFSEVDVFFGCNPSRGDLPPARTPGEDWAIGVWACDDLDVREDTLPSQIQTIWIEGKNPEKSATSPIANKASNTMLPAPKAAKRFL